VSRSDEDRSTASFLRGMTLGAIVGAIIARS
jgi:gas vesicle protein